MIKTCIIFFLLIIFSCKKDDFCVKIENKSLSTDDSLRVRIYNNTDENYLFYFESDKLGFYPDSPNRINLEILKNNKQVEVDFSSDPLIILEEGLPLDQNVTNMSNDKNCFGNDLVTKISSNSSIMVSFSLTDSTNICGGTYYPLLKKGTNYTAKIKFKLNNKVLSVSQKDKIKRKIGNSKLFNGILESNEVKLKN